MSLIVTQQDVLADSLERFYAKEENHKILISLIDKDVSGKSKISLRLIDWFTTNYAKKEYTKYNIVQPDGSIVRFKVHNEYRLNLTSCRKARFDPFCRFERIMIRHTDNTLIETTLGQQNFIKWCIENKIIEYIEANYDEIYNDMMTRGSTAKTKANKANCGNVADKTRKKRTELSVSATKSIKMEEVEVTIKFNS